MNTMRLDIDLSNLESLQKQRAEHMQAVAVIDAAIAVARTRTRNGEAAGTPNLEDLPRKFTIADLIKTTGSTRAMAKAALNEWKEHDLIIITEQGSRGRATRYEKV